MKKLLYIPLVAMLVAACNLAPKDLPEYDTKLEVFPVKLKNDTLVIPMNTFQPGKPVYFEPVFEEGYVPEAGRYTFEWNLRNMNLLGNASGAIDLTTLSKDAETPVLDATVPSTLLDGNYAVYLYVYDKRTGVRVTFNTYADITSSIVGGNGVYILKNNASGIAEVDYFQLNRFPTADNQTLGYVYPKLATADDDGDPLTLDTKDITLYPNVIENGMNADDYAKFVEGGAAVDFAHQEANYWWHNPDAEDAVTNPLINTGGAWIILTQNDIVSTHNAFGQLYARFDDFFLPTQIPAVKRPQMVSYRGVATSPSQMMQAGVVWFINNNVLYGMNTTTTNASLARGFSYPMPDGRPMNVSEKQFVSTGSTNQGTPFWDASQRRIYRASPFGVATVYTTASSSVTQATQINALLSTLTAPAPTQSKSTVLAMLPGGGLLPGETATGVGSSASSCASFWLIQNDDDSKFYMIQWRGTSAGAPNASRGAVNGWEVPSDAAIVANPAPVMASAYMNNVIYYVKNGNEVWYYNAGSVALGSPVDPAASHESNSGIQIGAGETIVQLMPKAYNGAQAQHNYYTLTVLTSTPAGGYKYYVFFNKNNSTHELESTPAFTLEGDGQPVKMFTRLDYAVTQ